MLYIIILSPINRQETRRPMLAALADAEKGQARGGGRFRPPLQKALRLSKNSGGTGRPVPRILHV